MRIAPIAVGCLLSAPAWAGSGPWTLSQDDRSVYVGANYVRWSRFAGGEGSFVGEPNDVGSAVTRTDLALHLTYGLLNVAEFEFSVAYAWSGVSRFDIAPCTDLPLGPCETVQGLAPVNARFKVRVLDEFVGAPLSVAFGPTFRFADPTRGDRQRITSIGDGQTDLGGFVVAGRSGGLGGTWSYAGYLELAARHRLKIADIGEIRIPGDEALATADVLVYPRNEIAVGLALDVLHRPQGTDFEDLDPLDPDRFTGLSATSVKLGPKVIVKSVDNISFVVSSLFSVYARNNPIDAWAIGVGVGRYTPSPNRTATP